MRFTLSKMFLAVALVALACAGMTLRTRWWADGIITLTVLMYTAIAFRSFFMVGRDRAVVVASAVVGGAYLLISTCSGFSPLRNSLPTNHALIPLTQALGLASKTGFSDVTVFDPNTGQFDPEATAAATTPTFEDILEFANSNGDFTTAFASTPFGAFFLVGHCVWSWLFALLAGWFAGTMYDRRQREIAGKAALPSANPHA